MRSRTTQGGVLALLFLLGSLPGVAQVLFQEMGSARGILPYVMAQGPIGGLAAADYDGDGDIDLFVPNGEGLPDQLYRNRGDGTFEEIASRVGLDSTENNRAALWLDYDGDADLDLVVGSDCRFDDAPVFTFPLPTDPCPNPVTHRLYRQKADGTFEDRSVLSGLDVTWGGTMQEHRSGIVAGDIDNDGWLDLYTCAWNGRSWLLRNNRDGTFSDITIAAGVDPGPYHHQSPMMADLNGDGWTDIYAAVDIFSGNFYWLNQGDGTFVNVAPAAGVDDSWTDMGVDLGDYDNDGDMDLYVTNINEVTSTGEYRHNVFYRNDSSGGVPSYTEISETLGVDDGHWGWGAVFLDADNDGWLDLATTNGRDWRAYATDPSRFWMNTGGPSPGYTDHSASSGFDDTHLASGLIALDHDRDGDLDLLQTTIDGGLRLMENESARRGPPRRSITVRPRMAGPNHFAIGAVVKVQAGHRSMMRLVKAGVSTLGQEPAEAHFGVDRRRKIERLVIQWPDGRSTILGNVPTAGLLTVTDHCDEPPPVEFTPFPGGRPLRGPGRPRHRIRMIGCDAIP